MSPPRSIRWVIVGNSGSGKSTLAERLGQILHRPIYDLDRVHWQPDGRKRDEADARARVAEIAATDAWIVEGVYGWLAEVALVRATRLIWLDIPWDACRAGLLARGLRRGMTVTDQNDLLAWAQDYWTRTTSSSFTGHERLYRGREGASAHPRRRGCLRTVITLGAGRWIPREVRAFNPAPAPPARPDRTSGPPRRHRAGG